MSFKTSLENKNNFLSQKMQNLTNDIPEKVESLKVFLFDMSNVPQGGGGINFINPLPIISGIRLARQTVDIENLKDHYHKSFWMKDYMPFQKLDHTWCKLKESLDEEIFEIKEIINEIKSVFISLDYKWNNNEETEQINNSIKEFSLDLDNLIKELKNQKKYFEDNPLFAELYENEEISSSNIFNEIKKAISITREVKYHQVLVFNPEKIRNYKVYYRLCLDHIGTIQNWSENTFKDEIDMNEYSLINSEIKNQLEVITYIGDGDE